MHVRATPKVEHADPVVEQLIHDQKWPVVRDMVCLLGICPQAFEALRQRAEAEASTEAAAASTGFVAVGADGSPLWPHCVRTVEAELSRRGGFRPLMHLFPTETAEGLRLLPWHALDRQLRVWTSSRLYQQLVQEKS